MMRQIQRIALGTVVVAAVAGAGAWPLHQAAGASPDTTICANRGGTHGCFNTIQGAVNSVASIGRAVLAPALHATALPPGLAAALQRHLGLTTSGRALAGPATMPMASDIPWAQQAELAAPAHYSDFGYSVALSGNTALVGAPGANGQTGAVYVFGRGAGIWTQEATLTASDGAAGDFFGTSITGDAGTVVVGAPAKNGYTGAAYVFRSIGGTRWIQQAKLTASDGAKLSYFGQSVAFSGATNTVLVGAYGRHNYTGAAYVFRCSPAGCSENATLTASDAAVSENFGYSVALSHGTALIGAPGKKVGGTYFAGAAYVFTGSTAAWAQLAEFVNPAGATRDEFGQSVALSGPLGLSGDTALVGTILRNTSRAPAQTFVEHAYVFVSNAGGGTWTQQATLTAKDGVVGDEFGVSVAISGNSVLVGAPGKNNFTGSTYVFVRQGTTWTQQSELSASDGTPSDAFGQSVALSGSTALVGAPMKNGYSGTAYVFVHGATTRVRAV